MAAFPTTVATDADLYIAVNATSTQLTDNPLTSGATTVNVTSTAAFPTVGFISIDNEIIKYTGKTATSFTGCTRGADGTAATSHVQNSQVFHNVIAAHHNAVKDDLIATEQFISDLIGRTNTQIRTPNGSSALPSHAFANATGSGMFYDTAGATSLSFSHSGSLRLSFDITNGWTVVNGRGFEVPDGTAGAPAYSFTNDPDTGIYRAGANDMRFSAGGSAIMFVQSTGVVFNSGTVVFSGQMTGPDGSAAAPNYSFNTDPDTGMFRVATNDLGFSTAGVQRLHIDTAALTAALPLAMGSNKITGLANATATGDALHFGQLIKIKQIVVGNTSTYTTTTSTTRTDTNLSATITPTSASSTILVIVAQSFHRDADGTTVVNLDRAGTNIVDTMALYNNGTGGTIGSGVSIVYRDSPATTSATTYKTQFRNRVGAGNNGANGDGAISTQNYIYLIELEP